MSESTDRTVIIDCYPDSLRSYREGYAVVAIDVIRASTTAITAVASGRKCYPVPSLEAAVPVAARLNNPLLVGELGGNMPYGFDMNNSPAEMAARNDIARPAILLSTSGTQVMHEASKSDAGYVACLRNYQAQANYLVGRHQKVAIIGARTRGEFREEDQVCCAWIVDNLIRMGWRPEDENTREIVGRWRNVSAEAIGSGKSAEYLRNSGQLRDLDFLFAHLNDLPAAFVMKDGELVMVPASV